MRVVVDYDLCESNALCMAAAPEVFEVRDDDFLYVLQDEPRRGAAREGRGGRPPLPQASHHDRGLSEPRTPSVGLDHIVIVGASLAGLRAAEELRSRGHAGAITLVGDEPHRPYDRPPLSKQVLAGTKPPESTALSVVERHARRPRPRVAARPVGHRPRPGRAGRAPRRRRAARLRRPGDRHRRVAQAAARHRPPRRRPHAAHARRLPRDPGRARRGAPPGGGGRRRLHRRRGGGHLPGPRHRREPHRGAAGAARARARPRDGRGRRRRAPRPRRRRAPRRRRRADRRRRPRRAHPAHRRHRARRRPRGDRHRRHARTPTGSRARASRSTTAWCATPPARPRPAWSPPATWRAGRTRASTR